MKIKHKCGVCKSSTIFNDPDGTFILPGGNPDSKGRIFLVEVRSDEWLEIHNKCLNNKSQKEVNN